MQVNWIMAWHDRSVVIHNGMKWTSLLSPALTRTHIRRRTSYNILQNMSTNALQVAKPEATQYFSLPLCLCEITPKQNNETQNAFCTKIWIFFCFVWFRWIHAFPIYWRICTNSHERKWLYYALSEAYLVNECRRFGALIQLTLKSLYFLIWALS